MFKLLAFWTLVGSTMITVYMHPEIHKLLSLNVVCQLQWPDLASLHAEVLS